MAACGDSKPKPEVSAAAGVARPPESTANLPSDTGSQTTLPTGAVTGAGQPEGTGRQPDVGSPGGLEPRARAEERADMRVAQSPATGAAGRGAVQPPGAEAADRGAAASPSSPAAPAARHRPPKAARG